MDNKKQNTEKNIQDGFWELRRCKKKLEAVNLLFVELSMEQTEKLTRNIQAQENAIRDKMIGEMEEFIKTHTYRPSEKNC